MHLHKKRPLKNKSRQLCIRPRRTKKALAETGSHILVMDLYAKTMIKQPNVNLSNINLGSEGRVAQKYSP